MAAIQSTVEFKTFAIDQSTFVNRTMDKVRINDHFYSDKTALSYLIGVPIYFVLYKFGITFSEWPRLSYYLITLLTIGLSISIMLVYFFSLLERYKLETKQRFFYVASLGIGTLILPYGIVFNSHGLGAAFIFLAFYSILNAKNTMQLIFGGVLAGLAASIDLVAGNIFLILFIIFFLIRTRLFEAFLFFIGAVIPIIIQSSITWHISGSIIPFNIQPEFFNYPGSAFNPSELSGVLTNSWSQSIRYAFDIIIGRRAGFLYYSPILYFSFIGLIIAFAKNKYRLEGILVSTGILSTLLYLVFKTNNYGGCAYGMRFTVSLIPVLYSFTPLVFSFNNKRTTFLKFLFILALIVSVAFSLIGIIDPWSPSEGIICF